MKGWYTQFYCTNCKTITGLYWQFCCMNCKTITGWYLQLYCTVRKTITGLYVRCNNSTALIAKQLLGKFLFNLEIVKQQTKKNP